MLGNLGPHKNQRLGKKWKNKDKLSNLGPHKTQRLRKNGEAKKSWARYQLVPVTSLTKIKY